MCWLRLRRQLLIRLFIFALLGSASLLALRLSTLYSELVGIVDRSADLKTAFRTYFRLPFQNNQKARRQSRQALPVPVNSLGCSCLWDTSWTFQSLVAPTKEIQHQSDTGMIMRVLQTAHRPRDSNRAHQLMAAPTTGLPPAIIPLIPFLLSISSSFLSIIFI